MKGKQKRARGTGRIWPRGRLAYIQYYDSRGVQRREPTGLEYSDANRSKLEKILRKKIGAAVNGIQQDSRSLKYEDVRDPYVLNYQTNERKSLRRDRHGRPYLESVERLNEFFAGIRVADIDTDLLRKFQAEMQAKGYANGTINRSLASLRAMLTQAQREEKIRSLPYVPMLPESKPRKGTLPHEKYPALVAALPTYLRAPIQIAYGTGMRRGEILGLTWSNVNFLDRIIRIEDSKNGEPREIPFAGDLETVLKEQFAKRVPGCDRVCFRVDRLGHPRPIGNFRKVWARVCCTLGLGQMVPTGTLDRPRSERSKPKPKLVYHGLLLHDLRRTFVSSAEHAGAPRHEVMSITGHKSESVYKRYAIGDREQRRLALEQIQQYRTKKVRGQFGDNSASPDADVPVKH